MVESLHWIIRLFEDLWLFQQVKLSTLIIPLLPFRIHWSELLSSEPNFQFECKYLMNKNNFNTKLEEEQCFLFKYFSTHLPHVSVR